MRRMPACEVTVALLLLFVGVGPADSAEPEIPPPKTAVPNAAALRVEVLGLIRALEADQRATRIAAEERLLALGPDVLDLLPAPEVLTPAAREAVARVATALETTSIERSLRAARVSLQGTRTVADWARRLSDQSGNTVSPRRLTAADSTRPITLDLADASFWEGLDALLRTAQLARETDRLTGAIDLMPGGAAGDLKPAAVLEAGPCRVVIESAVLRPAAKGDAARLLRVTALVEPEPRLRGLFLKYAAADITARPAGRPEAAALEPFNPEAQYELTLGETGGHARMTWDFSVPAGELLPGVDLACVLRLTVAAGAARATFAEPWREVRGAAGLARRRAGVTITLQRARLTGDNPDRRELSVRLGVLYDRGGPAFESHRTWVLHNRAYMETDRGLTIEPNAFDVRRQVNGGVLVEFTFQGLDPETAKTFVYEAPTLIAELPVRFETETLPVTDADSR